MGFLQPMFKIDTRGLPVVDFGTLLTFFIRMFFVIAGLAALLFGILGALAWITSEGEKDKVAAARDKIQAAIVGIFILIIVLTIIYTLEQVVFRGSICFGISCDISIPSLNVNPLQEGSLNLTPPNRVSPSISILTPTAFEQLPDTGR